MAFNENLVSKLVIGLAKVILLLITHFSTLLNYLKLDSSDWSPSSRASRAAPSEPKGEIAQQRGSSSGRWWQPPSFSIRKTGPHYGHLFRPLHREFSGPELSSTIIV